MQFFHGHFSSSEKAFMEHSQIVWNISRASGTFPDRVEHFQSEWNISRESGTFPERVEHFQIDPIQPLTGKL